METVVSLRREAAGPLSRTRHLALVTAEPPPAPDRVRLASKLQRVRPDSPVLVEAHCGFTGRYPLTASLQRMGDWLARNGLTFHPATGLWVRHPTPAPEAA